MTGFIAKLNQEDIEQKIITKRETNKARLYKLYCRNLREKLEQTGKFNSTSNG